MSSRKRPGWDGLQHDVTGRLAPVLPLRSLVVPTGLHLDGDLLCYGIVAERRSPKPGPGLLDAFAGIETPEDVLRFARKWGVLSHCEHGLPSRECHHRGCDQLEHVGRLRCEVESFSQWRKTVEVVKAILRLGHACREESLGEIGDCVTVWNWNRDHSEEEKSFGKELFDPSSKLNRGETKATLLAGRRGVVQHAINRWIALAEVHPFFSWGQSPPSIEFYSNRNPDYIDEGALVVKGYLKDAGDGSQWIHDPMSLFGALGLQLMYAVAGCEGITTCSACGKPFYAQRQRAKSRDKYCPACGRGAAVRAAKRRQRERDRIKKAMQRLRRGGNRQHGRTRKRTTKGGA